MTEEKTTATQEQEAAAQTEPKVDMTIVAKEETDVFEALDALDQDAIVKEMQGAIETMPWVYGFKSKDGSERLELTKDGVDECLSQLAKSGKEFWRETDMQVVDNGKEALFTVTVERWMIEPTTGAQVLLDKKIGMKRQSKERWSNREKRMVPDPFWFEGGGQKAIRNANKRFIPIAIKLGLIEAAKKKGRIFYIGVDYRTDNDASNAVGSGPDRSALPQGGGEQKKTESRGNLGAYILSPKQQKMVYAILGRAIKGTAELQQAWENIMEIKFGHRVKHEFPDKESFEMFLAEIRRVETPEDYARYLDVLRSKA